MLKCVHCKLSSWIKCQDLGNQMQLRMIGERPSICLSLFRIFVTDQVANRDLGTKRSPTHTNPRKELIRALKVSKELDHVGEDI